ncbi:hypothetical protein M948_18040 [Virgibacillus sp. CM-4]|uniref:hypothetical protein n=1 Tax=Virgibacillus sp. CM-4 TaxID=1354277 RepID=UPI000388648F|nr:hypothetical protein [Virgibacillus sp. CM-4]EQB35008.1 hypothetical protein M948_18040 [Virgibacillus sp. CM-4]
MVIINFLDGDKLEVEHDTFFVGINNNPRKGSEEFYLSMTYAGSLDGDINGLQSALNTGDKRLGIGGFLLSHDAFSVGDGEDKTIYFTSAIKSISVI